MDKKKIEIIAAGGLIIVLVIMLIPVITKRSSKVVKKQQVSTEETSIAEFVSKSAKADENIRNLQDKRSQADWGRDPFFFSEVKKVYKGKAIVLRGVSVDSKGKGYALVNDDIVTIGDIVSGYTVMEVQKNKVLLQRGKDSFYLGLPEE